jgi:hypothetical protein
MLFSRPGKEPLGGIDVTPFAQEKVDGAAVLIDGAIEIDPLAFNFDVGLIHTPGVADWPCAMISALFKFRNVTLDPPKNGRMGQPDSALRHHLDQVAGAEFKGQVPPHAQHDDLLVKIHPVGFLSYSKYDLCRVHSREQDRRARGLHTIQRIGMPPYNKRAGCSCFGCWAVKNSQKRSEAFGSDRNNAGGLAVTLATSLGVALVKQSENVMLLTTG